MTEGLANWELEPYGEANALQKRGNYGGRLVLLCQQFDEVVDIIGFFKNG
jgi:hypothetical protein